MRLFNGDFPELNELSKDLTDALSHMYIREINDKTKPIGSLFQNLSKLVENSFMITKKIISNLFTNPDMLNKSPNNIIEYIEKLVNDGYIHKIEKLNYILDIIKNVYLKINSKSLSGNFMEQKYIYTYTYFSQLFWHKFMVRENNINSKHFEIHNLSNCNYRIHDSTWNNVNSQPRTQTPDDSSMFEKMDQLLILENYYQENFNLTQLVSEKKKVVRKVVRKSQKNDVESESESKKKVVRKVVLKSQDNDVESEYETSNDDIGEKDSYEEINGGNISDELDAELGL